MSARSGYFTEHPEIVHASGCRSDYTVCGLAMDFSSEESEVGPVGEFVHDTKRRLVNCSECGAVRDNVSGYRFAAPDNRLNFEERLP